MGLWTIEYVCDDSSSAGNYWDASNSSQGIELTGARIVGGFMDGIGNTYEIYQMKSGFALVGGCYGNSGYRSPVANACCGHSLNNLCYNYCSGVLVLKRSAQ